MLAHCQHSLACEPLRSRQGRSCTCCCAQEGCRRHSSGTSTFKGSQYRVYLRQIIQAQHKTSGVSAIQASLLAQFLAPLFRCVHTCR